MSGESMPFPLTAIILERRSWRTYGPEPVAPDARARIHSFISDSGRPPFGSDVRFRLVDFGPDGPGRIAGTYGVIKGAKTFLAGAVRQGPMDLEDFGYRFERIILFATGLGLDTCWMGATFSRSLFAEKMDLAPGEILPIVSPVGYRAGRRSLMDTVFHWSAGSRDRKPWSALFFDGASGAPLVPETLGEGAVPFEMVRLAPSAVNKQPWRLVREGERVDFYLDRTRGFERMFATDLQRIDIGIAMCHFEIGAAENGIPGGWKIEPPLAAAVPGNWEYRVSWTPE